MTELAYSLEAMRALLMLDASERERAIETIEKLASAYGVLCAERDIAIAAGLSRDPQPSDDNKSAEPASDEEAAEATDSGETDDGDTEIKAGLSLPSSNGSQAAPVAEAIHIPGTLPLGTSANFCLAPFSKTGDFVVALDDKITVVSLIDVIDGLHEGNSE